MDLVSDFGILAVSSDIVILILRDIPVWQIIYTNYWLYGRKRTNKRGIMHLQIELLISFGIVHNGLIDSLGFRGDLITLMPLMSWYYS